MFTTFTIKNFRAFRRLTLGEKDRPLNRFNLIVGKNNAGKTAALEAIFLMLGAHNPQIPTTVNALRGYERFQLTAEDIWGWLFANKSTNSSIEIACEQDNKTSCLLTVKLEVGSAIVRVPKSAKRLQSRRIKAGSVGTALKFNELTLTYREEPGRKGTAKATISDDAVKVQPMKFQAFPYSVFLSAQASALDEDVERFSKIEGGPNEEHLLESLRVLEPRLRKISVAAFAGFPYLRADLGLIELIPLKFLGGGFGRLFSFLLAIANSPGGTVLIDEIENGIHYSVLEEVWASVAKIVRAQDVQLFATTHSWECMRAAHEVFATAEEYDLSIYRLDRDKLGDVSSVAYDREMIESALAMGLEVR